MRILQTIPCMQAAWGGPSTCTCDLLNGLHEIGAKVDLLTTDFAQKDDFMLGEGEPWMKTVKYDWRTPLAFSKNFKSFLEVSNYDIYHTNTIWLYPSHVTCKVAREKNRPYVLSPHGMLYPTALKVSAWKKWPIKKLWVDEDIRKATCLHATCEQEMKYIRDYGYHGPVAIIPNPVVFPDGIEIKSSFPDVPKMGYLGRLHPIKKVENLLYGAALATEHGWQSFRIEIMGKGTEDYEDFLRSEVQRLGLNERVDFVGFVSGREKYERLASLWALFVPSAQENFGMIVPEALICGTPVYASTGTPWKELTEFQCGWWGDNTPEMIAHVIEEVMEKGKDELLEMGGRGRKLMEEKYEQHKVAKMMDDLYRWLYGTAEKPEFVYEES